MKLNIVFRHVESTEAIREKIIKKTQHLKKFFHGKSEINWVCSVEQHEHSSEVLIHAGHNFFHAKASDENLYKTFDQVIAKLEKQLSSKKKYLEGLKKHKNNLKFGVV
jgi:putative sigma-54 modulation protein